LNPILSERATADRSVTLCRPSLAAPDLSKPTIGDEIDTGREPAWRPVPGLKSRHPQPLAFDRL
jgi:hypothetical protein